MSTMAAGETRVGTTTWQIDPQHSEVGFEVSHMMFAKVRGRFESFEGTITLGAEETIGESRVDAEIQAASIDTGQAQRDEHLRSADFFDVERFPTLTFASTSVRPTGDAELLVTGNLTIHGVTREVELTVTHTGQGVDPWGSQRAGFSGETHIDRRDFDLTWNQALEAGGILVGNEVTISLEIQAVLQAD